ncbi:hypothetical protein N7493_000637 [Penicillium malachiteum]|uniref:Uncharacterized protein n=1 Tax=Penicillium malachiteum TaxID=1324776 RepID=A0AAD6HWU0_9EURO|nr:hypothetical protein N7493_000637 [Penicillium malachiteum]
MSSPVNPQITPAAPLNNQRHDASNEAFAEVMSQKQTDAFWHPVAFWSQTMSGPETRYEHWDTVNMASFLQSSTGLIVYDLVDLVPEIDVPEHQKLYLKSFVNVLVLEREQQEQSKWHLFNDFSYL